MGQALLMGLCAHFKCKFIWSLEMAKGRILAQSFFFKKRPYEVMTQGQASL